MIAVAAKPAKEITVDMSLQESYVAAMNLGVLGKLEAGDTDAAKQFLAKQVGSYHHNYSKLQHAFTKRDALLLRIEKPANNLQR